MAVKIITDTSCDLPEEYLHTFHIEMLPLKVTFADDQTYLDRFEISPAEFLKKMQSFKELPKTSAPDPATFIDSFQRGLEECGQVIFISISSGLSSTYQAAQLASQMVDSENIFLFDSLTASLGTGIAAVTAAEMAANGEQAETIMGELNKLREKRQVLFTLDTLENVVKGGRLSKLQGMAGTVLHIKPILRGTREGMVEMAEKIVGRKKALHRLLDLVGEVYDRDLLKDKLLGVSHVSCPHEAYQFARSLREKYQLRREVIVAEMGATIGTYAGAGGLIVNIF